jgi:hypothetical protein
VYAGSKVVTNVGEIGSALFNLLSKDSDLSEVQTVLTGAHCQLKGIMYRGYFLREYQVDFDKDGGYMRYMDMPMELYIQTNGSEILELLERNGWPVEGVSCRHSYSPCGGLYCDSLVLFTANNGLMRFKQRVWRNV